jgi:hypothetical protein
VPDAQALLVRERADRPPRLELGLAALLAAGAAAGPPAWRHAPSRGLLAALIRGAGGRATFR